MANEMQAMDIELPHPGLNRGGHNPLVMSPRQALFFRFAQFFSAVAAIGCMLYSSDFAYIPAYLYMVIVLILQTLWSMSMIVIDIYAASLRTNPRYFHNFTIGDGIVTLLVFTAASASMGMNVMLNDWGFCVFNPCTAYKRAMVFAFISWFASSSTFFANFATCCGLDIFFG